MRAWSSEPGVINADVTQRVAPHGYFYAPDPSSQSVCSIGGNVAENSGGAHCLKYGFTTTHVLALEVVLPDGSIVHLGSRAVDRPGYDLPGIFVGSEGTLGIATKVVLRIVKKPAVIQTLLAAFNTTEEAGAAVSGIIGAGMLPAAIEMMDNLAIQAAEASVHAGYPNCGGLLLVELDGPAAEVEHLIDEVSEICTQCGAWEIRVAQSEAERAVVWKGRKAAFAAMGRISPNYIVQDGVIPRTALPKVLSEIERMSAADGLARGQRVSCGRWESASPGALRRAHPRPGRARHGAFHQHSAAVRGVRRVDHRRTRRGRREKDDDGRNVRRARPGNDATRALRVRSRTSFESGQGVSPDSPVRGENRAIPTASSGSRWSCAVLLRNMGTHSSSGTSPGCRR
jgi:FAD/FMN-containing dehydrogenase